MLNCMSRNIDNCSVSLWAWIFITEAVVLVVGIISER